jgi:hypothetical protein
MDLIERLLGIAPDGGSGSTEALIMLGITMIVVFLARRHRPVEARGQSRH